MAMFDSAWVGRWQEQVNRDGVMANIGKHLTADVLLEFGDAGHAVSFRKGRITEVESELGPETCWNFALRAPAETWEKFCQEVPPPMYNDMWAMAHPLHGRLVIDGDVKVLWQNLRAFTWALALMRDVTN